MKGLITLNLYDRYGRLKSRKIQPMRSFTLGLMELFYCASGHFIASSPSYARDVDFVNKRVVFPNFPTGSTGYSLTMTSGRLSAGGGLSAHPDASYSTGYSGYPQWSTICLSGQDIGIVIGNGTTAVTPADRRLEKKFGHGVRGPDGSPVVMFAYTGSDSQNQTIGSATTFGGMLFIPDRTFQCTSAEVKIYKSGSPGNCTVIIRGVDDVDFVPNYGRVDTDILTGTILEASIPGASPGSLVAASFGTVRDLYAGHYYSLIASTPVATCYWRYETSLTTGASVGYRSFNGQYYNYPVRLNTSNGGTSWGSNSGQAAGCRVLGQSLGEFEYGGCFLDSYLVSNPNAEFVVRRQFRNNCGSSLTVNEVGLQTPQTAYASGRPFNWSTLIARDIIGGGQVVADTEVLEITYTVQITV